MTRASPNPRFLAVFVDVLWEAKIAPQPINYVCIPNRSPTFDAKWVEHLVRNRPSNQ